MSWKEVKIGDVCEVVSGATPKTANPAYWDGDIAWATPKDLSELGQKHIIETHRKITQAGLESCSARVLPASSVLFSSRAPIGLVAINRVPLCTNQGFKSMIPLDSKVSPDYLYWWLLTHRNRVQQMGRGATFKEVSKKIVESLVIPLPPLAEQKRIAAILDAADYLRAKRRESIELLDSLLRSAFLDMFGDPVTNPMGWEVTPFDELGEFVGGSTPSKAREDYWHGTTPWVSPKDMKVSRIHDAQDHVSDLALDETSLKLLEPGHLLVVVRGMILAHSFPVAINRVPIAINQDMKGILPSSRFDVGFLLECVRQLKRRLLSEVSTAGHGTKRFDSEAMRRVPVPTPPTSLQRRFAAIVESIEKQKELMRAHLAELDTLFASLQQRAFNGEL